MREWSTISEKTVFSEPPFIKVVRQVVDVGNHHLVDNFFQVHLKSFVVAVPVLENSKILTIKQYKHGPGKVSLTFPAGFVEPNEHPDTACRRELLEETGLQPKETVHLGEFVDNGNQRGCVGNYYIQRECQQVSVPNSGDLETMILEEKTAQEIDEALFKGEIAITHHAAAWAMARLRGL